jgi:hypothetical protein
MMVKIMIWLGIFLLEHLAGMVVDPISKALINVIAYLVINVLKNRKKAENKAPCRGPCAK